MVKIPQLILEYFCIIIDMDNNAPGIITKGEFTDYLYRVATRVLIRNDRNEILLVREQGHDWWDLPGGGLEYGESIYEGLKRELFEEVGLSGKFDYKAHCVKSNHSSK